MTKASRRFAPLYSIALLIALGAFIELAVRAGWLLPNIIAPPSLVIPAFGDLRANGDIVEPFFNTFFHVVIATAAAATLGLPFGYFLARQPLFDKAYRGWLAAAFASPLVLLYPLFLVFFGRTYFTVVLMSTMVAFVPIAINARDAFTNVPPVLLNVGKSFKVDKWQRFRMIELPAAVPTLFVGLRLGVIYALVNTIGVEFLIDFGGLGRVVSDLYAFFNIPQMYAEILLILVVSIVLLWTLDRLQRWVRPQ
ncbi:MAG TPA: ABC transporter permease subunit [Candidatus Acidoferrales bacterium]|nr:ABC transporter permease subunit [Candidatus Acidoferrales bacterium]